MSSIWFDKEGICSYCKLHDKIAADYPNGEEGWKKLQKIIDKMKEHGRGSKYDCILGLSGGRDSTYSLYKLKQWGLRPLAVYFHDGFSNPIAGENIKKATTRLGVDLRTMTSDWRESKDIKLSFLKASTPDLDQPTDLGVQAVLYGAATTEGVKYIINGHSFRTEGMAPLDWLYYDGKYLNAVQKQFGTIKLRSWKPKRPGFNLDTWQMAYYTFLKQIRVLNILYYLDYKRTDADKILTEELDWKSPGAHYNDDLYQSLVFYVHRVKFGIDKRKFNYSGLIRSGQMTREVALKRLSGTYIIEDPKVIDLCIKRLGITNEELEEFISRPVKTFRDYPSSFNLIKKCKLPIKIVCKMGLLPNSIYHKYFNSYKG
jgi:N-acetyl sugar amidotransferase